MHVGGQRAHELVGGAGKIEHVLGIALLEIKHAEVFGVGRNRSRTHQVDEFATDRRADHEQFLAAIIEDQMDPLAGPDLVPAGERVVDDHLIVPLIGEIAAAANHDVVDHRLALVGQRQDQAVERFGHAGQVDRGKKLNPRTNRRHAGQLGQGRQLGAGNFLDVDPEIGHAALRVIMPAGPIEIVVCRCM